MLPPPPTLALWVCLLTTEGILTILSTLNIGLITSNHDWSQFNLSSSPLSSSSDAVMTVSIVLLALVTFGTTIVLAALPWMLHACLVPWSGQSKSTGKFCKTCCAGCCCGSSGCEPFGSCAVCMECAHPCGACPSCCCCWEASDEQEQQDPFLVVRSGSGRDLRRVDLSSYEEWPMFMQEMYWSPALTLHMCLCMMLVQFCSFAWMSKMVPELRLAFSVPWNLGILVLNGMLLRVILRSWRLRHLVWPLLKASRSIVLAQPHLHDTRALAQLGQEFFRRLDRVAWNQELRQVGTIDWLYSVQDANVRTPPSALYLERQQAEQVELLLTMSSAADDASRASERDTKPDAGAGTTESKLPLQIMA